MEIRAWLTRAVLVAFLLALLELLLLLPVFPAAASSALGLGLCLIAIARVYLLLAVPLCALLWWLERWKTRLTLPDPVWLTSSLVTLGFATALTHLASQRILTKDTDFPQTQSGLLLLAAALCIGAALLAQRGLIQPGCRRLLANTPNLAHPRTLSVATLVLLSCAALGVAHILLAPVHRVTLCAVAGVCGLTSGLLASRLAFNPSGARVQWSGATIAALLLLTLGFDNNATSRFVLYGPASTSGPIAAKIRALLDHDGDGTSPVWAGGADCDEGDASRGPHVAEVPGDGVDQDCRNGDAPALTPQTPDPTSPLLGCQAPAQPRSLLLITIDALRADTPSERVMPNLLALARSSLVFTRAYAPSTMTGPSLAGLFSGQTLGELHPNNAASEQPLRVSPSLPQLLKTAGFRTAAFNHIALKTAELGGFDEYNPEFIDVQPRGKGQLLAAGMLNSALAYARRDAAAPFFAWVHLIDTHAPYVFDAEQALQPAQLPLTPYERGAWYVDAQLGRLLRELSRTGQLENMVIAITSDHGEETGAHGRLGHGPYLFEDVINVPLVIFAPGCGRRMFEEPVSLTHLGGTLAALAGASLGGGGLLQGGAAAPLPVVVEEAPASMLGFKRAVILGSHKMIVDVSNGGRMLFDLSRDALEAHNLYGADRAITQALETAYQAWLDRAGQR